MSKNLVFIQGCSYKAISMKIYMSTITSVLIISQDMLGVFFGFDSGTRTNNLKGTVAPE